MAGGPSSWQAGICRQGLLTDHLDAKVLAALQIGDQQCRAVPVAALRRGSGAEIDRPQDNTFEILHLCQRVPDCPAVVGKSIIGQAQMGPLERLLGDGNRVVGHGDREVRFGQLVPRS